MQRKMQQLIVDFKARLSPAKRRLTEERHARGNAGRSMRKDMETLGQFDLYVRASLDLGADPQVRFKPPRGFDASSMRQLP